MAEQKRWYRESLSPSAERALTDLQRASVLEGFYLAGGTGLALHLGHRRSADLDFFSSEPFDEEPLLQKVQQLNGFSLVAKGTGALHARIEDTKVSFLSYAYPLLFPLESFLDAMVADAREIACMKISAIAGRGTKRDFVDLYAVSKQHGLRSLVELFRKKFAQASYSLVHVLKSLTYFADAEKDPMPDMLAPVSWDQVKRYFEAEAPRLL